MVEFLRNAKDRKGSRAAREREKSPVKEEEIQEDLSPNSKEDLTFPAVIKKTNPAVKTKTNPAVTKSSFRYLISLYFPLFVLIVTAYLFVL